MTCPGLLLCTTINCDGGLVRIVIACESEIIARAVEGYATLAAPALPMQFANVLLLSDTKVWTNRCGTEVEILLDVGDEEIARNHIAPILMQKSRRGELAVDLPLLLVHASVRSSDLRHVSNEISDVAKIEAIRAKLWRRRHGFSSMEARPS